MAKAQELGIPIINEDEFLDMIKNSHNKSTVKKENKTEKVNSKSNNDKKASKCKETLNKSYERKSTSKERKIKNESDLIKTKSPKTEEHSNKDIEDKVKVNGNHNPEKLKQLQSNSDHSTTSSLPTNS